MLGDENDKPKWLSYAITVAVGIAVALVLTTLGTFVGHP
jgi:hypothetical protein